MNGYTYGDVEISFVLVECRSLKLYSFFINKGICDGVKFHFASFFPHVNISVSLPVYLQRFVLFCIQLLNSIIHFTY